MADKYIGRSLENYHKNKIWNTFDNTNTYHIHEHLNENLNKTQNRYNSGRNDPGQSGTGN